MQRLKDETPKSTPVEKVDLCALLADFAAVKQRLGLNIQFHPPAAAADHTEIDRSALLSVLEHVVSNAAEAANGAPVTIGLEKIGDGWRISVRDCGQGMAPTFLADELFRPLRSTKGSGFGLGAYQARQTMHELQGELEIKSEVGAGTTVELLLPATSGTR
jgi:signal transduction histidine kinase